MMVFPLGRHVRRSGASRPSRDELWRTQRRLAGASLTCFPDPLSATVLRTVHDATRRIQAHIAKSHSPNLVDGAFCELRPKGVLGSPHSLGPIPINTRGGYVRI